MPSEVGGIKVLELIQGQPRGGGRRSAAGARAGRGPRRREPDGGLSASTQRLGRQTKIADAVPAVMEALNKKYVRLWITSSKEAPGLLAIRNYDDCEEVRVAEDTRRHRAGAVPELQREVG